MFTLNVQRSKSTEAGRKWIGGCQGLGEGAGLGGTGFLVGDDEKDLELDRSGG